jgi:hypothetical protein
VAFGPVELNSSPTAVAVRAADLTLCEFSFNGRPWIPASSQKTHGLPFRSSIQMVKFENHRVCLTTVNTTKRLSYVRQSAGSEVVSSSLGDQICLTVQDFERLSKAFFDELEQNILTS